MRCRDRDCDCQLVPTCQLRQYTLESICELGHMYESEHTDFVKDILTSTLDPAEKLVAFYLFRYVGDTCAPKCMHTRELLIEKIAAKMHLDTGSVVKIVDNFFLRKFIEIAGDSVFVNFENLLTSCKVRN